MFQAEWQSFTDIFQETNYPWGKLIHSVSPKENYCISGHLFFLLKKVVSISIVVISLKNEAQFVSSDRTNFLVDPSALNFRKLAKSARGH